MIYIQKHSELDIPHHFDAACAMYGAIESDQKFELITFEDLDNITEFAVKRNLFVGSVEFMQKVFNIANVTYDRKFPNNDKIATKFTVQQAIELIETNKKMFFKPAQVKLFTGCVFNNSCISILNALPADTILLGYEPYKGEILSEWRCYVLNNKIVSAQCYAGDPFIGVSKAFIENKSYVYFKENKTFPTAFTMDVAVLNDEKCTETVVEYNDMWSIGNYGIENALYLRMLKDRYFEIIKN